MVLFEQIADGIPVGNCESVSKGRRVHLGLGGPTKVGLEEGGDAEAYLLGSNFLEGSHRVRATNLARVSVMNAIS